MGQHIIVSGTPVEGFTFIGPFDDSDDAASYAEYYITEHMWWVLELDEPEEEEDNGGTNAAD